jgi:hypothetical protein
MADWLKKAPTGFTIALIIVVGILFLGVIAGYVILSVDGVETLPFTRFIGTLAQLILLPIVGVGTTASIVAAKSASKAEEQTNGSMKSTMKDAVREVHEENNP